jgi:hypothetical protein
MSPNDPVSTQNGEIHVSRPAQPCPCYSTDPDKHALFGVEDGLELLGSAVSRLRGHSSGLLVYTDY